MGLILIVPQPDSLCDELHDLPVEIAVLGNDNATVQSQDGLSTYSVHELATRCIGALANSAGGLETAETFLAGMAEAAGIEKLPLCNLTQFKAEAREEGLLRFVASTLADTLERRGRRVADLSRSLAALRQSHGEMQVAFAQLEKFVLDHNLAQRTETLSLLPGRDMPTLALSEGATLTQRLPISSTGLSDVGIFIEDVDIADQGMIHVTLLTKEDNVVRGHWTLSGSQIRKGTIRLALHTALETPALTPFVEVKWLGDGDLRLSTSLYHPDPGFQLRIGESTDPRVLALRCWSYLPGSEAPIPASAHLSAATGSRQPRVRILDSLILAQAEDLTPDSQHSSYLAEKKAVLVHPMTQGVSMMRIADGIPAGTVHVDARIHTQADQASVIEYALGIAPSSQRSVASEPVQTEEMSSSTPWVGLGPQEPGELHLPFAEPLEDGHDLYLMTRLAVQPGDNSWGWATFSRIRVTVV